MATYNLNHTSLDGLLDQFVSSATENVILQALIQGGLWHHGQGHVEVEAQSQSGAYTIPSPGELFLDIGNSGAMTLTSLFGHDVIAAGDGANWIIDQGPGGDTLVGGSGKETLQVMTGDNVLIGGGGLNTLMGGDGHDLLIGGGESLLEAGAGGSTLVGGLGAPHGGSDEGEDHVKHEHEHGHGHDHDHGHHSTVPMDTLTGGAGDDLIQVYHGDNVIIAGTGHDTIYAGDGADKIFGSTLPGATNAVDTIYLGTGDTSIQGGSAGEATIYAGMHGDDTIFGTNGGQKLTLYSDQSSKSIQSSVVVGGVTTITFKDHQSLSLENVTVHFSNGTNLKV